MSADLPLQFTRFSGCSEIIASAIIFQKNQRLQPRPAALIHFVTPFPAPVSPGSALQRLVWAYLSPSSRALATSLMEDISTDVHTLGSKVTLADAIVLDAILGPRPRASL